MPELADRFLFEASALSQTFRVARFEGHEGMNELYRFELTVVCDDPAVDLRAALGTPACLTLRVDGESDRYVHGIIARFQHGDAGKKVTTYRVTLVPRAHLLHYRSDIRIFQELTAPDILQKVLEGAGLTSGDDFRLSLQGTYRTREYCVQFRESDFAFISRLMEEEGISYFFEHEAAKHTMVLVDKPGACTPIAGEAAVVFRPGLGALTDVEHVSRFTGSEEIRTGKATFRDYDFKKPNLLLEGTSEADVRANLEVYDYPGPFDTTADAAARAKDALEEAQLLREMADGETACMRFLPGFTFDLTEHARDSFNRSWLIASVDHHGAEPLMGEADTGGPRYENRFQCLPADAAIRPPFVTPRPSVKGVQSAIVCGPSGEEIHVDEHGRVKVQFHWDRLGKKDDKSTCWIRVSQIWAGAGWGAMHIPRIGQEVLVDFLDGDPDRPVIVGRVYHGANVPPYALPANKTKSTIKSNSTPGGGGFNELTFEDAKDKEEVYLHAQKDQRIEVLNDKTQTVGHDEKLDVGNDRTLAIGHDQSESIGNDETFSVGHDRVKSVGNDEVEEIGANRQITVGKDHAESIGGSLALSVAKDRTEEIGEEASLSVGKSLAAVIGKNYGLQVAADSAVLVDGKSTENVKLEKLVTVGEKIVFACGDSTVTVLKDGTITIQGKDLTIKASGDVKVEADGKVDVKATGDVKVESSGKVDVKSSGATNVDASGPVKVKGANVAIN